jgi:poly(3-hydroxyalkanoate) synthetase
MRKLENSDYPKDWYEYVRDYYKTKDKFNFQHNKRISNQSRVSGDFYSYS